MLATFLGQLMYCHVRLPKTTHTDLQHANSTHSDRLHKRYQRVQRWAL